jgi:hypothetical protein
MGQIFSQSQSNQLNPVNVNCPVCQKSGKTPNLNGRFHIINLNECQCNGCKAIFEKKKFFKPVVTDAEIVDRGP